MRKMNTFKRYIAGRKAGRLAINETEEFSLNDLPWTIYIETDEVDALFQQFQKDHASFLKGWMRKNIKKE